MSQLAQVLPRNYDLVIPLIIVVVFVRGQYIVGDITQKLFHGLSFFLPYNNRYCQLLFSNSSNLGSNLGIKVPDESLSVLANLKVRPIDMDGAPLKVKFLKDQIMYSTLDALVITSLCTLLSHISSLLYRCIDPNGEQSSWSTIFTVMFFFVAIFANLRLLVLTGYGTGEVKITIVFAVFVAMIFVVLFYGNISLDMDIFRLGNVLDTLSGHISAVLLCLSPSFVISSVDARALLIFIGLFIIFLLTLVLGLPVIRFSQLSKTLLLSSSYERAPFSIYVPLLLDVLLPIIVSLLFCESCWIQQSDGVFNLLHTSFSFSVDQKIMLQLTTLGFWCLCHVSCFRMYLQSFNLAALRMAVIYQASGGSPQYAQLLQNKILARSLYMVPFALQFMVIAFIPLSLGILIHRSSNISTGFCDVLRAVFHRKMSMTMSAMEVADLRSVTDVALDLAKEGPYLDDLLHSVTGITLQNEEHLVPVLQRLIVKLSKLSLMGPAETLRLCQATICLFLGLWAIATACAQLFWLIRPTTFELIAGGAIVSVAPDMVASQQTTTKKSQ